MILHYYDSKGFLILQCSMSWTWYGRLRLVHLDFKQYSLNFKSKSPQVVLLDENGKDITSEQLANLIGDTGTTGASAIVFCIGGPYGHGQQLRMRADVTIRLSSMVLNHQIALIVLIEQLYRAWTILKGQKYHHQ